MGYRQPDFPGTSGRQDLVHSFRSTLTTHLFHGRLQFPVTCLHSVVCVCVCVCVCVKMLQQIQRSTGRITGGLWGASGHHLLFLLLGATPVLSTRASLPQLHSHRRPPAKQGGAAAATVRLHLSIFCYTVVFGADCTGCVDSVKRRGRVHDEITWMMGRGRGLWFLRCAL